MPEAATRPVRTRAARTTKAAAAPKTAKSTATEETPKTGEDTRSRIPFSLVHDGDTKSYAKFVCPEDMKGVSVGSIYAPLGTEEVKVLLIGPA